MGLQPYRRGRMATAIRENPLCAHLRMLSQQGGASSSYRWGSPGLGEGSHWPGTHVCVCRSEGPPPRDCNPLQADPCGT